MFKIVKNISMVKEKKHEKIREIATTVKGHRFAVAEFHTNIQVWDVREGLVNKFITDFEFGGNRLSISEDGIYLVVASYSANTITAFDINKGCQVW